MKELTIEVTNQCSLNCLHCSTQAVSEGSFMLPSKVEKILSESPSFGKVRFSGGEPFEHPRIAEILENTKRAGKVVHVLSCGVVQGKSINHGLVESCAPFIDELVFSMHGLYSHDFMAREYGAWNNVLDSSAVWLEPYDVPYSYECVLTNQVYQGLEDLTACLSDLKKGCPNMVPHLHVLRLVKQGRAVENWDLIKPTQEQVESLPRLAERLSYNGFEVTYSNSFKSRPEVFCDCGSAKKVVQWDGAVIPCSALKEYSGPVKRFACEDRV